MRLRNFTTDDAERVWELHNLPGDEPDAEQGPGMWDEDMHYIPTIYQEDGGCFIVGEWQGDIVAIGAIKRTTSRKAELKRMRVHPDHQRQGFGSALLNKLEAEARTLGFESLHLDASANQTSALRLYEKHGYCEVGRYAVAGLQAIVYEKRLTHA